MARAYNPYRGGDYRSLLPLMARLLARRFVASDGCWIWQGQIDKHGYGRMSYHGRKQFVHRLAYEELVGPIPSGTEPDHLCNNRACFNPAHLQPVTQPENNRRGLHTKLTHADIAVIRSTNEPHTVTAAHFGVHPSTIGDIRKFKRWNYYGRSS